MKQKIFTKTAIAAALVLTLGSAASIASTNSIITQQPAVTGSLQGLPSFADVVERVSPAVVNISVSKKVAAKQMSFSSPFGSGKSPLEEFFGRKFQMPKGQQEGHVAQGLGSGFILDSNGHVVTNHHVVEGADEIKVTLTTGEQLNATLIGSDPKTDLALLKVEADSDLPHVVFANTQPVRVGDWVLAIGNPFGLGGSATAGIVSAMGRDIQSGPYDNYIQIDAPINRGNSGGPVFDSNGYVIGVNTAIFSPNGGNIGIGFAIPSEQVKGIIDDLKDSGRVSRGWLGVQIQTLDDALAESLKLDSKEGALIARVIEDSPALRAGINTGDVIVEFNHQAIDSPRTLSRKVAEADPSSLVPVKLRRNGVEKTVQVKLSESEDQVASSQVLDAKGKLSFDDLGLSVQPVDDEMRQSLKLADDANGIVVTEVKPGSIAAKRGLTRGDVIASVNGTDTHSLEDFNKAILQAQKAGDNALLLLRRAEGQRFVALSLA